MSAISKMKAIGLGPAPTRLRQIALVTRDLEKAKYQLVRTYKAINRNAIADGMTDTCHRHRSHFRGSSCSAIRTEELSRYVALLNNAPTLLR